MRNNQNSSVQLIVFLIGLISLISCNDHQEDNARKDSFLTPLELPKKYGYPSELHYVVTRDGYILAVFRIPHGKERNDKKARKVVLLTHGIFGSSADFIILGPKNALGYLLAAAGYDVWMMNNRGNAHSRNHTYLSTKSAEFWNFDWHEIGIYDIPATIDYILNVTNTQKLIYIGHSQGSTSFFILTSILPEYNSKIELHISLAPIVFTTHTRDLPIALIYALNQPALTFFRILGVKGFLPASELRTKITNAICDKGDILQPICMSIATLFQSTANLNKTTWIAIQGHYPAGSSWKQIQHYGQIFNSGRFRQYDYGSIHNRKVYKRSSPPDYDLKKVTAPVILIEASNDLLAIKQDIDRLQQELPNVLDRHVVSDQKFSHADFTWGIDAKDVVYRFVLQKIIQYAL